MSNNIFTRVETGVVAELDGKFFGVQYEDGRITDSGFGPIEKATISDPKYCRKATDLTYKGSYLVEPLSKAKLKAVTKTTVYVVTP